jgi:hypothetical protein
MTILDLIVIVTTILFFVRWKRSKLGFIVWLFERGLNKYLIKAICIIFLLVYILYALIVRVDLSFLNYRIF